MMALLLGPGSLVLISGARPGAVMVVFISLSPERVIGLANRTKRVAGLRLRGAVQIDEEHDACIELVHSHRPLDARYETPLLPSSPWLEAN
jgi:hypothetical protein